MAKDHYIPASYLGRFSQEGAGKGRDRRVSVVRRTGPSEESVKVSTIGSKSALYNVDPALFPSSAGRAVDDIWSTYESSLTVALDHLVDGSLDATEWIEILVPFVAALFVRDQSYGRRVDARMDKMATQGPDWVKEAVSDKTNINLNRLAELNRWKARALACEWTVWNVSEDLLTSDLGYHFECWDEGGKDWISYMVPIGTRHLLSLIPRSPHVCLKWADNCWVPNLEYAQTEVDVRDVNGATVSLAQNFVCGPVRATRCWRSQDMAQVTPEEIEGILAYWPYRGVDTRRLSGMWDPIREMVRTNARTVGDVPLDPWSGLTDLEPKAKFVHASTKSRSSVHEFITVADGSVIIRVD